MKKRILTVLLAGVMCFSMTTAAFAAETDAAASETAETTEMKLLGEDAEGAFHVALKNSTGKDIKEVKINVAKKVEYKDAENLLKEDDIFKADEERLLCCVPLKEEKKEADTEKDKEPEIPVYNIKLTFADDTTAEVHTFPFGDIEEGELHLEGEIAYLVFDSVSLKESVNTLETETKIADEIKAAAEAAAARSSKSDDYYEDDYYDDYYYDDSNDYYYEDSGSDNSGGDDSCLEGGLLF